MTRVKVPEARTPLRGRGRAQCIRVTPAADDHTRLLGHLENRDLAAAIAFAARDARWLRPADAPALVLAQLIAAELADPHPRVPQHAGPVESDEVGTIPAFDLPGGGGKRRDPPDPPSSPPLRTLAPILFQLLTGLGMLPEARARLGITLVEEPEPIVPRPARLPRAAR